VPEHFDWTLTVPLLDDYDPDEMAQVLREIADRIEGDDMPPLGHLWSRTGHLLGFGRIQKSRGGT
jgi:hypothetical protein